MPSLSYRSMEKLRTCHPDLIRLALEVIKIIDFSVIEGHRDEVGQNMAVKAGRSKTPWPQSKHNRTPSLAFDIAPYPVDWTNSKAFYFLAGVVVGTADKIGVKVRWGGAWSGDIFKNRFEDLPHFELVVSDEPKVVEV